MKNIILFLFFVIPILGCAQYPGTGNKQRLGWQTTGDGLVYRDAGYPSYTPNSRNNAYVYMDTVAKRYYHFSNGAWYDLSDEKYIHRQDQSVLALAVRDSLTTYDRLFVAMEITSAGASDRGVQLPVTAIDSTYAGRVVRVSSLDSSGTYNVFVASSSPDGLLIDGALATTYYLEDGETVEFQLYVFDTIYQWRLVHTNNIEAFPVAPDSGYHVRSNALNEPEWYFPAYRSGDTVAIWNPNAKKLEHVSKTTFLSGLTSGTGATDQWTYWSGANTISTTNQLVRSADRISLGTLLNVFDYTTVGTPAAVGQWDIWGDNTVNGYKIHNGTRAGFILESTFPRGTSTRVPYFNANGQITESSAYTFDGTTLLLTPGTASINSVVGTKSGQYVHCAQPTTGTFNTNSSGALEVTLPDFSAVVGAGQLVSISFEILLTSYTANAGSQRIIVYLNGNSSGSVSTANIYSVGGGGSGLSTGINGLTWRAGGSGGRLKFWLGELAGTSFSTSQVALENVFFFATGSTIQNLNLCSGWTVTNQASAFGTVNRSGILAPQLSRVTGTIAAPSGNYLSKDLSPVVTGAGNNTGAVGAIEFTLPASTANLSGTVTFQVRGSATNGAFTNPRNFTLDATWSYSTLNFTNVRAQWDDSGAPLNIRLGDNGTRGKIWIGETAGVNWAAYLFEVTTFNITYAAHTDFVNGWSAAAFITTFGNIDVTASLSTNGAVPVYSTSTISNNYSNLFSYTGTQFRANNYIFNADQSLGSGQNGYALRWNNSTSEFEASADLATVGFDSLMRDGNNIIYRNAANTRRDTLLDRTFGNADLTFTGNRSHAAAGFSSAISGLSTWNLSGTGTINYTNTSGSVQINNIRSTGSNVVAGDVLYQEQWQGTVSASNATFARMQVIAMQNNTRASRINIAPARASTFGTGASITTFSLDSLYGEVKLVGLGNFIDAYPSTYDVPAQVFTNGRTGMDLFASELNGNTIFRIKEDGSVLLKDVAKVGGSFFTQTADATISNTTTETTLTNTGVGTLTIPADYFQAGQTYIVRARGYFSTNGSTPNLTLDVEIAGTDVGTTTAFAVQDMGGLNETWELEFEFTVRSTGASGTAIGQGDFKYCPVHLNCRTVDLLNTSTFAVNTTTANAINVSAEWGTASTDNTITCTNLIIEAKN